MQKRARGREATVKSAASHLKKQNSFRAPHYLFANEEKRRWAGPGGGGDGLIAPSSLLPSIRSSVKRSDKKITRPEEE